MITSIASEITRISNNISDAYSACSEKGATIPQTQNSANLADTINSITAGSTEAEEKDVNFVDWDGTILYSYTEAEAMALTELPPLPVKAGYTYQGWNWTLAQIKASCQPMTVGAIRIPSDGASRFTFDMLPGDDQQISFSFTAEQNLEVSVDWGDGTSGVYTSSPVTHQYSALGSYVVKINSNQTMAFNGFGTYKMNLLNVEFGSNITQIKSQLFNNYRTLRAVSIPGSMTMINSKAFYNCTSLRCIVLPDSLTSVQDFVFDMCYGLNCVSFPGNAVRFFLSRRSFASCYPLRRLALPATMTGIGASSLDSCTGLSRVIIPQSVNSIGGYAFNACISLRVVDLSARTTVPTMDSGAFQSVPSNMVIYVKNAQMLSQFQSATNWSEYANKMQIGGKYAD